ncbi:MAG: 6-phosphogluconolactonase [Sneathiella sp.]|nr:6-phosphogluconolactonase [Sneathiella sp.]
MLTLDEHLFSTRAQLDTALSGKIADLLANAIDEKNAATLVLSGGNTPKGMLDRLSQYDVAWDRVTVLLADERWVTPDSERSNEKMIRECFLKNAARSAHFQGMQVAHLGAYNVPDYLEDKLEFLDHPADVLVLGMGEDGHTASLFPCAENIEELLSNDNQLKTVVVEPKTAPDLRISLSFPVLKRSDNIFVHFTGDLKKEIFQKISSGYLTAPLGALLTAAEGNIRLYWAS